MGGEVNAFHCCAVQHDTNQNWMIKDQVSQKVIGSMQAQRNQAQVAGEDEPSTSTRLPSTRRSSSLFASVMKIRVLRDAAHQVEGISRWCFDQQPAKQHQDKKAHQRFLQG